MTDIDVHTRLRSFSQSRQNQQIKDLDLVDLIELEFDDEEEIMYINPAKRRKGQQLLSDYFQK